jgi:prevent-host-death family protein
MTLAAVPFLVLAVDPAHPRNPRHRSSVAASTQLWAKIELYSSRIRTEEFFMWQSAKNGKNVVSALQARSNFGKLLRRVAEERKSLVIEKRGTPQAILLSIRDYVRLAAPEPEVLRLIGEESVRKGTDKLTSRQIDREIAAARRAAKR